jgi:hypothetical protein
MFLLIYLFKPSFYLFCIVLSLAGIKVCKMLVLLKKIKLTYLLTYLLDFINNSGLIAIIAWK